MEERKHLLDYLTQVFTIFGITILAISIICTLLGEAAAGESTMYLVKDERREGVFLGGVFTEVKDMGSVSLQICFDRVKVTGYHRVHTKNLDRKAKSYSQIRERIRY